MEKKPADRPFADQEVLLAQGGALRDPERKVLTAPEPKKPLKDPIRKKVEVYILTNPNCDCKLVEPANAWIEQIRRAGFNPHIFDIGNYDDQFLAWEVLQKKNITPDKDLDAFSSNPDGTTNIYFPLIIIGNQRFIAGGDVDSLDFSSSKKSRLNQALEKEVERLRKEQASSD